jgi:hypothetical protein
MVQLYLQRNEYALSLKICSNNDYHPGLGVVDPTLPATGISLSEWIFVGNRNPSTKEIIKIMN